MKKTPTKSEFAYMRISKIMEQQILNGTLRTGDKLLSLRTRCREYGVSQNTALSAYYYLERSMLVETRPQSGYYVQYSKSKTPALPPLTNPESEANYADSDLLVRKIYDSLGEDGHLPLALGSPTNALLPIAKLNKGLMLATRELKGSGVMYDKTEGNERIRRQIARWSFAMECNLTHDEIITTSGCLNALSYCMMALTNKGDT